MKARALVPLAVLLAGTMLLAQGAAQPDPQGPGLPTNNLPNPYSTVANYFKLPDGRDWGSTSAVEIDKDGRSIWVAERCGANSCLEATTIDIVLKFDSS